MKMTKKIAMAATILASIAAVPASAASIIYTGFQQVGATAVNYSITTDGSIGSGLTGANLVDYSFTLSNGADIRFFDKASGFTVGPFSATSTALSVTSIGGMLFEKSVPVGVVGYGNFVLFLPDQTQARIDNGATYKDQFASFSNTVAFATVAGTPAPAVPEPASWAMMILGMGAVGGALRRRSKVATQVAFA